MCVLRAGGYACVYTVSVLSQKPQAKKIPGLFSLNNREKNNRKIVSEQETLEVVVL